MAMVRTMGALLFLLGGCSPSAGADTKTPAAAEPAVTALATPRCPEAATSTGAGGTPAQSAANTAATDTAAKDTAAKDTAVPTSLRSNAEAPSDAPSAPALEHLTYHALPQTHLGFYAVLTPPGYDAPENATRRYSVVVILHGSGSNELIHGTLADDLGREDVIYVLPRAPHVSTEQFAAGKEGYTAWPNYPAQWGSYGSPGFPRADVDRLQVHKYYTRWIAECVLDARQRYRVNPGRAVVVGHSQGATFAHLFAADYPALVKAYAAYAGPSQRVVDSPDVQRQMSSLRAAAIVPLLIHHEGDTIVDVSNTKQLDALMTKQGVRHTTHLLPGGTHATDPTVRRLLRDFTREQCCGKERSTADVPVTTTRTLSVPPMKEVLTYGPNTCNEYVSGMTTCDNSRGREATCRVYEAEPCGRASMGYRASNFECLNSVWTRTARSPAECGIDGRDPDIAGCKVQLFRTRPTELSSTDQCDLVMRCNNAQTVVTCDGENDGKGGSLCECTRGGVAIPLPQDAYAAEAPLSCIEAAKHCVTASGAQRPETTGATSPRVDESRR